MPDPASPVLDRFSLEGRVAIVTGGSEGIGRAMAEGFASVGAKVVVASRKAEGCEDAVRAIEAAGGEAIAVPTHVGHVDQLAALVARTVDAFGGIDIVVNNAANPLAQPLGAQTAEAFQKSWEVNLRGPVFLVQEALPYLKASDHAAVLNVITSGIYTSGHSVSLYVAAKSALEMMTRTMAAEYAPFGIRVNALAPGCVATKMMLASSVEFQEYAVSTQLIRRMADPSEMVPAALFLVSDASSFMTGQPLVVDGGLSIS
jgi:NAD(P)-dependent dehydrogenase (short-subunit alcohol dehydrogenase family)